MSVKPTGIEIWLAARHRYLFQVQFIRDSPATVRAVLACFREGKLNVNLQKLRVLPGCEELVAMIINTRTSSIVVGLDN